MMGLSLEIDAGRVVRVMFMVGALFLVGWDGPLEAVPCL